MLKREDALEISVASYHFCEYIHTVEIFYAILFGMNILVKVLLDSREFHVMLNV